MADPALSPANGVPMPPRPGPNYPLVTDAEFASLLHNVGKDNLLSICPRWSANCDHCADILKRLEALGG